MDFLGEITDVDLGLSPKKTDYRLRRAARAILLRDGKIALIHVSAEDYYKIPGGGVDEGEDIETALRREVKEETGCDVCIDMPVGVVVEVRDCHGLIHLSYCYFCRFADEGAVCFSEIERASGFRHLWVGIDDALKLIKSSKLSGPAVKFMVRRDTLFLNKAKELLS